MFGHLFDTILMASTEKRGLDRSSSVFTRVIKPRKYFHTSPKELFNYLNKRKIVPLSKLRSGYAEVTKIKPSRNNKASKKFVQKKVFYACHYRILQGEADLKQQQQAAARNEFSENRPGTA